MDLSGCVNSVKRKSCGAINPKRLAIVSAIMAIQDA